MGLPGIRRADRRTYRFCKVDRCDRTQHEHDNRLARPSVLAIFKNFAIEGGVQAPIYRDASDSVYGHERVRFAINVSYLKFSSHTRSH